MGMRANVFALPAGTVITSGGDTTKLTGQGLNGLPYNQGIPVGEYDILAIDLTVSAISSGTLTFYYDRLGADGNWYPVYTAPFTAPGVQSTTLAGQNSSSQEFGLIGRLRWTLTGGPATCSASIVGK